ncbi:hypothetical protein KIN20_004107 [Parelaphostrongylus tenuis]|uniref:Uncharacterized protein n=1 Tax=Parelaphostrongylus tenuis TaxID=148309 RepID=A0AAD5LYB1_PARTN|nr:hypothetical protein KIN20_004107 [Parelaphostrongylus tenuis]
MLNYGSQKRRVDKKKKFKKEKVLTQPSDQSRKQSDEHKDADKPASSETTSTSAEATASDAWSGPVQETIRTIDDDIDEFLDDLFE